MFNAILEITIMLLGAFGIGILAARQYWLPKLQESQKKEQESHNKLVQAEVEVRKEIKRMTVMSEESSKLQKELKDVGFNLEEKTTELSKQTERIHAIESVLDTKNKEIGLLNNKIQELENAGLKPVDQEKVAEAVRTIKAERSRTPDAESAKPVPEPEKEEEDRESRSYYEIIEGKKYDKAILDATRKAVAGQGDGRISMEDAQKIYQAVNDANQYTDVEKDTLKYIRENFRWTEASDQWFRKNVRSWAAKRGWETLKNS